MILVLLNIPSTSKPGPMFAEEPGTLMMKAISIYMKLYSREQQGSGDVNTSVFTENPHAEGRKKEKENERT